MRTLGLLIRTNFLELVGSYNRKGKSSVIVATVTLIFVALFMIGLFAIIGGSTAFILQEKGLSQMAIFISSSPMARQAMSYHLLKASPSGSVSG